MVTIGTMISLNVLWNGRNTGSQSIYPVLPSYVADVVVVPLFHVVPVVPLFHNGTSSTGILFVVVMNDTS